MTWDGPDRRQHTAEQVAQGSQPGRMPLRRIPGTAMLAVTNLIASLIAVESDAFSTVLSLAYLERAAGEAVWAAGFGLSAAALAAACVWRRWTMLNIGATLSLFLWTATSTSIVLTWAFGSAVISPIALALVFWMVAGQASMLIPPLLLQGRWADL